MSGKFVTETDVAKRPVDEVKAIDPDIAVLHHASNSTRITLPENFSGSVKCFRYQPTPLGRNAPAPPVLFVSANGPSMLQSDRKSTRLNSSHANISYAV